VCRAEAVLGSNVGNTALDLRADVIAPVMSLSTKLYHYPPGAVL